MTVVDLLIFDTNTNEAGRITISVPGVFYSESALRKRVETEMDEGILVVGLYNIHVDYIVRETLEEESPT